MFTEILESLICKEKKKKTVHLKNCLVVVTRSSPRNEHNRLGDDKKIRVALQV